MIDALVILLLDVLAVHGAAEPADGVQLGDVEHLAQLLEFVLGLLWIRPAFLPVQHALESFQILEEIPSQSATEKRYGAILKMKKPPQENRVEFVAVGHAPMWIFRDEDYKKQGSMGEEPNPRSNTRRPAARGR